MATIDYKITFYSDWHTGSGLTSGSDLDALVLKDKSGLPYIPGKTLKGLLREAACELIEFGNTDSSFLQDVFGLETEVNDFDDQSGASLAGEAHFSNATINTSLKNEIILNKLQCFLMREYASTAILPSGVAKKHSLRRMEASIPVILEATIHSINPVYTENMRNCFMWIKRIGLNRNRGLGRCTLEITKIEA